MTDARSGVIVTLADVRACNYCMSGCRTWALHNKLNWREFVVRGLPVEVFDALNDGLGNAVAAKARERAARDV